MASPIVQRNLLRASIKNRDTRILHDVAPMFLLLALIRHLHTRSSSASLRLVLIDLEKARNCSQILLRLAVKYIDAEKGQRLYSCFTGLLYRLEQKQRWKGGMIFTESKKIPNYHW